MRTLVIEDDPSVGGSIELVLKARGHSCDLADNGAAGLELARAGEYDIILLDLSLPDLGGHEVLRKIRACHVQTPVLILSGSTDRQDKIKGLGIGADDYVTKPFDNEELLARIRAIVRRATGRTPPTKAAVLDGALLAKRGQAAAWSFTESYAPPSEEDGAALAKTDPRQRSGPGSTIGLKLLTPQAAPEPVQPNAVRYPLGAAKIIVLGNGKGGTGKSTIAMHLIAALLIVGHRVGSLDCDHPQGTLTRYIENRRQFAEHERTDIAMPSHECLDETALSSSRAERVLSEHTKGNDFVVIDTPGHDTELSRWAHARADTLITPINDSFIDLDVLAEVAGEPCRMVRPSRYSDLVTTARRGKEADGGTAIDWVIVRNRLANIDARNRRRMDRTLEHLAKKIGFREGPGLRERVIYRELFLSGLTLLDLPRERGRAKFSMSHVAARQELRHLLDAIQPQAPLPARESA